MRALLYCTKSKPYLIKTMGGKYLLSNIYDEQMHNMFGDYYNGKIVAEIEFEIEEIVCDLRNTKEKGFFEEYTTKSLSEKELLYASKIDEISFINYLNSKNGYAIHITHCVINWKAKDLNEYYDIKGNSITKAPQNMCYAYNYLGRKYVLISVKPEWLAKILNREKTIEVRKKVLKEMVGND